MQSCTRQAVKQYNLSSLHTYICTIKSYTSQAIKQRTLVCILVCLKCRLWVTLLRISRNKTAANSLTAAYSLILLLNLARIFTRAYCYCHSIWAINLYDTPLDLRVPWSCFRSGGILVLILLGTEGEGWGGDSSGGGKDEGRREPEQRSGGRGTTGRTALRMEAA
jgi:hypothetical protein